MRVGTSESKRPSGRPSREIVVAEESCKCNAALRQGRIQSSFLGLKAHCRHAVEREMRLKVSNKAQMSRLKV